MQEYEEMDQKDISVSFNQSLFIYFLFVGMNIKTA
jgi:hypothetical protein